MQENHDELRMRAPSRINYDCPKCGDGLFEDTHRQFAASKELSGWSWKCPCGWQGTRAKRWADHSVPSSCGRAEREPFTDWPNNMGTYD